MIKLAYFSRNNSMPADGKLELVTNTFGRRFASLIVNCVFTLDLPTINETDE